MVVIVGAWRRRNWVLRQITQYVIKRDVERWFSKTQALVKKTQDGDDDVYVDAKTGVILQATWAIAIIRLLTKDE